MGCIQRILDLHVISFDIAKFLEVARVYSLDVCVDIPYENSEKVKTVIEGTSSLLPITTSSCRIYKYRRTGLLLTKKAKNNGEALPALFEHYMGVQNVRLRQYFSLKNFLYLLSD